MKICICGWYFNDYVYSSLLIVNHKHPVFIVAHKDHESLKNYGLPYEVIENKGFEWGAYSHYIKNVWDGSDSVLFMHDDILIKSLVQQYEIRQGELVFDYLASIQHDQAYIFQDRREDVYNYGQHGRMVLLSERLLTMLKPYGLPSDTNTANSVFKEIQEKRPGWSLLKKVYAPNIEFGYKGKFRDPNKVFEVNAECRI